MKCKECGTEFYWYRAVIPTIAKRDWIIETTDENEAWDEVSSETSDMVEGTVNEVKVKSKYCEDCRG